MGDGCGGRTGGGLQGGGDALLADAASPPRPFQSPRGPPTRPRAPSCWAVKSEGPPPTARAPPHIQSLPPHSCGLAPPLLETQPPGGSLRTAPRPGCGEVHLRLARGTGAPRNPSSLALAVRKRGREKTRGLATTCTLNPHPAQCRRSCTSQQPVPSNAGDPAPPLPNLGPGYLDPGCAHSSRL